MNLPSYPDYDEERLTLSEDEGLIPIVTGKSKRLLTASKMILFSSPDKVLLESTGKTYSQ